MADLTPESTMEAPASKERVIALKNGLTFDESRYEYNDRFVPGKDVNEVHTIHELYELAKNDPKIQIEGTCLSYRPKEKKIVRANIDRQIFLESIEHNEKHPQRLRLREGFTDSFALDTDFGQTPGLVGQDFVPFLGGPFYKQLYIYDYLRMHGYSFWAINHWPMARAAVNIMRDFTLGRGYRIDIHNDQGNPHPQAEAVWGSFEEANDIQGMMQYVAVELSTYGEVMLWWLPDNDSRITYRLSPGQQVPKGLIPRVRLIDPSVVWEIVTYPEDITRVLYYQWVAPTQYQMYTNGSVPSTKFIMQQLPGDQVDHFKINCMSNEKRGRSDLFPALGYLKRLSDSVNYSIIGMQKATAWSIDTTVEGNQGDLDAYAQSQQALGTVPQAGSEFIHTSKIKREYLGNMASSRGGHSPAFEWCFSQAAMAMGIPVSYFGTHLSGAQTRASALVATEPVAKRFEIRQAMYERILLKIVKRVFSIYGIDDAVAEVTMPELLVQDRSAKFKDLALAEAQHWISKERAATIASKELQVSSYDYDEEKEQIDQDAPPPAEVNPLTGDVSEQPEDSETDEPVQQPSGITNQFRKSIANAG